MGTHTKQLTFTYASWPLHWEDSDALLATLCVFYDKIYLPYPYAIDRDSVLQWKEEQTGREIGHTSQIVADAREHFAEWKTRFEQLFSEGVLEFLPPPFIKNEDVPYNFNTRILNAMEDKCIDQKAVAEGQVAFAIHALYGARPAPEYCVMSGFSGSQANFPEFISSTPSGESNTDYYARLLAKRLFRHELPVLKAIHPEQILEASNKLTDYRAGLADYIYQMTDDVESRIQQGQSAPEIAAEETFLQKMRPQYRELQRLIDSECKGYLYELIDRSGQFLQVDAGPWSPRFWGALLELVFGSLGESEEVRRQLRTNQGQAVQFCAGLRKRLK
jgi:hypothetical protein